MNSGLFAKLLTNGYFPRELPPTFSSLQYGQVVSANWDAFRTLFKEARVKAHWITHTVPRSGLSRRDLEIPNPIVFAVLSAELADQRKAINSKIDRANWSTTKPKFRKRAARALLAEFPQKELPRLRADRRGGAKFVLQADVARFYPSVYTHSVPWVLHGKSKAKVGRNDYSLAGNRLDRALRNCNDGQTVGLPIGPDSSLAIAELILSEVDAGVKEKFPKPNALRFFDDYEFPVRSRAEAEDILEALQTRLGQVELSLNPSKTEIRELPIPFEHPWTSELRGLPFRSKITAQANDLIHAFDRAGDHARRDPTEPIFRYLLGRFARVDLRKGNWKLYQGLLLQSISIEPGTIVAALSSIIANRARGFLPDRDFLEPELNQFLEEHCRFRRTNEVAWLLWGMMILKFRISSDATKALEGLDDPFVALLTLHAEDRGALEEPLDKSNWTRFMIPEQLDDDHWLLAYEALVQGWLESSSGKNYVQDDPAFKFLARRKVRFYNKEAIENASPSGISLSVGTAPLFYID
jgi:hypothetical protein